MSIGSARSARARRNVPALIGVGTRFVAAVVRGRSPPTGVGGRELAWALVRAVRLHFFTFPAAAALAGAAAVPGSRLSLRIVVAAGAVGVAWGVGQLLNDVLDLEADAHDAPERPMVSGALPEGPAAAVALLLGVAVTVALACVHPLGLVLTALSALLLFSYGRAKARPGLGNLAHGALMAVMAWIGAAAALPDASLLWILGRVWPVAALTAAVAAVYLQANYEKDRVGDGRAGYRTLAHVLGLRQSALLRALTGLALGVAAHVLHLLDSVTARALGGGFVACLLLSAGWTAWGGDERSALRGYRFAVYATVAGLLVLAAPLLGPVGAVGFLLVTVVLVEAAFRSSKNP